MEKRSDNELGFLGFSAIGICCNWIGLLALLAGILFVFPAFAKTGMRDEVQCLALTIYFEARGESIAGKIAVGHVVMNRVMDPAFPDTVCGVVRQGGDSALYQCQFTWWCDGLSDRPSNPAIWHQCLHLARLIYHGRTHDPTDRALWYHARYVHPSWVTVLAEGPTIGQHVFYSRSDVQPDQRQQDKLQLAATGK